MRILLTEEEKKAKARLKVKKYREANPEKISARNKKYREANQEKIVAYKKEYYKTNQEKIADKQRERIAKDGGASQKAYIKNRRKNDPLFRLKLNMRNHVTRFLKGGKNKKTEAILGMTFKDFEMYLEVDYTEGMNLDHVVPVSWATTDEEVYALNHFSNFQILTADENMNKGNRFVKQNNLERTLEFHNNTELLSKIIERNLDRIT